MTPFRINASDDKLAHLRARAAAFPWFPAPSDEGDGWLRGINTAYLKGLVDHWLTAYDWRAAEADLNARPHFIAEVDGHALHFVHVVGEAGGKRPLLVLHGWPGSFYEFWSVIGPLAFPSQHGGAAEDAFDLVIPSLPGYAFSAKPDKPLGQRATARLMDTLMTRVLGYPRYMAQGGDWGSLVASWLGLDHAERCAAIHLNMAPFRPNPGKPESDAEADWLNARALAMQLEGGYFQVQATKPQTLAMALMDSPVGWLAWQVEKFHAWTDLAPGGLDAVYGKDWLLTNAHLYLLTDSQATSLWYYRAFLEETGGVTLGPGERVAAPTGVANFPAEQLYAPPPRSYAARAYNLVHWSDFPAGGHFAALERPADFVADLRAFAKTVGY